MDKIGKKMFEQLKNRLFRSSVLQCADFRLPYELSSDASEVGVGAALTQTDENG